jgi:hypothetical protein
MTRGDAEVDGEKSSTGSGWGPSTCLRFDRILVPYRILREALTIRPLYPLPKEMSIVPT